MFIKEDDMPMGCVEIPDELVKLFVKLYAKTDGWEKITVKEILDLLEKEQTPLQRADTIILDMNSGIDISGITE